MGEKKGSNWAGFGIVSTSTSNVQRFVPKEMLKILSAIIYYVQLVVVVVVSLVVVVVAAAFMHKFMWFLCVDIIIKAALESPVSSLQRTH